MVTPSCRFFINKIEQIANSTTADIFRICLALISAGCESKLRMALGTAAGSSSENPPEGPPTPTGFAAP